MKKSILFLINGYGVEQNDSIAVYSKELMPCLDNIIGQNMLVRLPNMFLDYRAAYRSFSMGIDRDLSHSLIERNISKNEFSQNALLKYIVNETVKKDSNLHIFCYVDSYNAFEELAVYVKDLKMKVKNKIFVHFILTQKSLLAYEDIDRGLNFFTYEMGTTVKVGMVVGEEHMNNLASAREIAKSLLTEAGEKWKDFSKKLQVFVSTKEVPFKARAFAVNYGYRLEENDQLLFFNYSSVSIDVLKKEIEIQRYRKMDVNSFGYYSLFPIKCEKQVPFMYNFALASTCFLNSLKAINARCLILDKKENCPIINYYLTGLRNSVDDNLKYVPTDDGFADNPESLVAALKTYDKELIIINYEVNTSKTVEELKERLNKIDTLIGAVYNYCLDSNYAFFVSSLYGMSVDLYNKKAELCKVNLFSKVPFILANTDFSASEYSVDEGNLFDLANTLLFTVNNQFPNSGLLKKKSKFFSLFKKKPKPVVEKIAYTNYNNEVTKIVEGDTSLKKVDNPVQQVQPTAQNVDPNVQGNQNVN